MSPTPSTPAAAAAVDYPLLKLRLADGSVQSGWTVADHGNSGLFLVRGDRSAAPQVEIGQALTLHWQDHQGKPLLEGKGEVAYSSGSGLRITLAAPLPDLSELIQSSSQLAATGSADADAAALAEQIVALLRAHLGEGLRQIVDAADRQLNQAAGRTAMAEAGLSPKAAHGFLLETADALHPAFLDDLCAPWRQAAHPDAEPPAPELGMLELVEDQELELWLLRSESAARLEQSLRPLLTELRPRMLALAERVPGISAETLLPEQILNSLVRACKRIDLPFPLRNLLIHLCREPAPLHLAPFYAALLALLRHADIGPGRTPPAASAPNVSTGDTPGPLPSGRPDAPRPIVSAPRMVGVAQVPTRQALATVHQIYALSGRSNAEDANAAPVSNEQLAQALARLLERERSTANPAADGFEQALRTEAAALAGQAQVALDPLQSESLALLTQLHQTLTDDPLLPKLFRDWILRLLPALLGTQLSARDPGERAEGIRNLFGLLEFAAVLCEGRRDASARQLAARIEELLVPLVATPALQPEQIDEVCDALEQLLQRHRRAGAAVEHRVVESCEGQQRLEDARRAAEKEIGLGFAGRQVPVPMAELIDEVVRPNLVLARLRPGREAWEAQLGALQSLADACRRARRGELLTSEPWIDEVRAGWAELATPSARQESLLHALGQALDNPEGAWIAYHAPLPPEQDGTSVSVAPAATPVPPALDLIKVGDWFGFVAGEGEPRLLKLAWLSPDRSRFVFVNQLGHKAEDLGAAALAEALQQRSVRLLDERDASTIERAWRRMLEGLHNELAQQATHDSLTGLLNRTEFDRRLLAALSAPAREPLAVLWIGVDHLSMINQTHGRAAGDAALNAVAQNLRRFVSQRGADAARIAGDEFALLLPEQNEEAAAGIARTICREVAERQLSWQGQPYHLSVSIGLVAAGADPASPESLLQDAERAYRLAREDGGGQVYRHADDDERVAKLRQTAAWVGRVEQALASRQMLLYAQPALSLSESAQAGPTYVEVLLRMDVAGEIFTPEQFLLAAERYGQIAAIDRYVSSELLQRLEGLGPNPSLRVAFNVSARNMVDADFVSELVARLEQQSFPLDQLCVELTETAAVAHLSQARKGMARLGELGVALVLDDFGSGYASYQYLKHLPVDVVKVDGAFIRDIARSPENLALARSINEIAHLLGKQTVAEHVEDEETLALVREIGFDYAQGFHICRPRPLDEYLQTF